MNMLNNSLWLSFEYDLSQEDITAINNRLHFLEDILKDASYRYEFEDVKSDLDLHLHIYLSYFYNQKNVQISPWLIHDLWFSRYNDGQGLNPELAKILKKAYSQTQIDLKTEIEIFLDCLNCGNMINGEVDAAIWLSFLDYLASKMIYRIGMERMQPIFGKN